MPVLPIQRWRGSCSVKTFDTPTHVELASTNDAPERGREKIDESCLIPCLPNQRGGSKDIPVDHQHEGIFWRDLSPKSAAGVLNSA